MKSDFQAAMRRALQLVRTQDVMEATRVIQRALSRDGASPADPAHDAGKIEPDFEDAAAPQAAPAMLGAPPRPQATPAGEGALVGWRGASAARPPRLTPLSRPAPTAPSPAEAPRETSEPPRRRLGDVLRRLRKELPFASGAPSRALRGTPAAEIPPGAAWIARSFSCAAGARDYKVYAPVRADGRARPLILMLHGCTQTPDDFAVGTRMNALADELGFVVAYPEQPRGANPSACWNWFKRANQRRDEGEPAILAGLARAVAADFAVDPTRIYVAGLSAGGAMAAILAATYPDLFSAAGVHSGLPYGAGGDLPSGLAAMRGLKKPSKAAGRKRAKERVRTIVFHGGNDATVAPSNAEAILADARAGVAEPRDILLDGVAGGRAYTRMIVTDPLGVAHAEGWAVEGLGHAWSGGDPAGSFADAAGPDASREMLRFFLETEGR